MSRFVPSSVIANAVYQAVQSVSEEPMPIDPAVHLFRLTYGLTEYERLEVMRLVRYMMASNRI